MSRWILLRGLLRESRHWGMFPEVLGQYLPQAEITAPDLAGNGALYRSPSPASVTHMVEHYRAVLAARQLRPPYSLLALSMGAMVAVEWACRHPGELAACVLINTSMRPFSPFYRRLQWQNYPRLLRLAAPAGDDFSREELILRLTSSDPARHAQALQAWVAYRREFPVSRANALRQLLAAAAYTAPGERPAVPMLVLGSSMDRLVHPSCSQLLAKHWATAFATHPSAGHDLPLDDGAWVAAQVRAWRTEAGTPCRN